MPMPRSLTAIAAPLVLFVVAPSVARAWNYAGHRTISSIAYRELDEATRNRVAEVLRRHPAYEQLWAQRSTNGRDETVNLFWNGSVFPDDARRPPWTRHNRPKAHYVDFRIDADQGNKVEPPVEGEDVINSYVAHLRKIRDLKTPPDERALHLSWVFHQAEDIHQPPGMTCLEATPTRRRSRRWPMS